MPSVMDAAMNSTDASISRSPQTLFKREMERIHISRGMLKIRMSVMELGRFTLREVRAPPVASSIILHEQRERNARRGLNVGRTHSPARQGDARRDRIIDRS